MFKNINFKTQLFLGNGTVLLLMLVIVGVVYQSINTLISTSEWVTFTHEVIEQGHILQKSLVDMETGERGYLITGKKEFLAPYYEGKKRFDEITEKIKNKISNNHQQVKLLVQVHQLSEQWYEHVAEMAVQLRHKISDSAKDTNDLQEFVSSGVGKNIMDKIHELLEKLRHQMRAKGDSVGEILVLSIAKDMLDQETGKLGYLITGMDIFLEPYQKGAQSLENHINEFEQHLADESNGVNLLRQVKQLAKEWREKAISPAIAIRKELDQNTIDFKDVVAPIERGDGKKIMDEIHELMRKFFEEEKKLLEARQINTENTANNTIYITFYTTLLAVVIALILFFLISRGIVRIINELSQTITYMTESNWEAIKDIARVAQDSANSTKYQGEFIQIKNALETAAIRLAETATKNEIQDWFKNGQAQLNELTGGDQEIAVLTKKIITFLTTYVQAQVGIFYLLRDTQSEPPYLQIIASYAYTTPKDIPNQFPLTEGLVGQSALERKTLSVTQASEECLPIIRSGLSGVLPHHVLLIPFLYENTVKGVIEIGTNNNPLTETQREFLEQVMPSIGITVNTAESRTQMQTLLQQTQLQADQLQQQQEELQHSNEELRRQQRQLEAQTAELEERTEELERQKVEMEQKNMALEQTQQTLRAKAKELELAIQYKSEFLANTSHELRTPLNGIIGLAESLIEGVAGELSEKAKANLTMIVGSGKRLATLVNDILDFSTLQHQDLELQLKPIGLREITEVVLTLTQPLVLNKPVQLLNAISAELPPARADENRLQQILYNLIGNAIKFTDRGTIEILAKVVDQHLELVVSDTGIGIPKDKLERIFESFEQGEGSTAREYGGTGLGLAVTKQLVQLHQGQIWVKSTVGQGSQFFLTLPIAEGQSSQLSTARLSLSKVQGPIPVEDPTSAPSGETIASEQLKILIVDDEPVNLQVLNNYLSLQNYHIVQANSGSQALTFIEDGFKPDAILLDVMMPKMTGYEVTQTLREKWPADEMPILLLTAKNQVADLVTGLESGANDYLTKPISKDELLARLKTHLQLKELKEEALQLALENERMKTELEVTRRLQQMILPKEQELDDIPHLEIAGFMEAADEVGGDYYDVLQRNGHILIGIGDVTGHGLESGMLMLMAQAGIRTLWEHGEPEVVKFLNSLNAMIYKNAQERMEVDKNLTLSLLEYQPQDEGGVLRISGRHEDIVVVRNGQLERIDTGELGFQVGFVDDIAELVKQIEVSLAVGDVVVLYTDGITEAENPQRQEYSIQRLSEVVAQNWQQPVKEIRQAVIEDVRQHIGEQKIFDDITLVVLKQI